ncbi:Protein of unknown function [Gryllus bimaculatus]|nr:Protein of unknown function [Gryllus bimaculatus]
MAHTPLRIVLDVLYVVLLVNCLHGIVGQERDLFEYEELTTQTVQPRASEHAFKKKEKALEQWNDMGCSEADSIGWMWVFECVPDKLNKYRVYGKLNSRPILIGEIIALPDKPPTIVAHSVSAGPGWVSIWARLPEEDYPNVLGIKVRFTVEELKGDKWVAGPEPFNETSIYSNKRYFQRVQYSGDRAMLWPIHECPLWPKAKMFCMLFTDKFSYSENFTKEQRIDLSKLEGWGTAELPETPESVDNNKKIVFMAHRRTEKAQAKALAKGDSTLGCLPRFVPLHRCCNSANTCLFCNKGLYRAGFRAADDMWTSWAEAPGNLIVGMGFRLSIPVPGDELAPLQDHTRSGNPRKSRETGRLTNTAYNAQ